MLIIIIGVVVAVLVIGGGAAAWFLTRSHGDEEEGGGAPAARKEAPKVAPTFLPMENMVVNLADPGGDRFAQIGITLELEDAKTAEQVKLYLPTIRSDVLLLVSQRTADELLSREGKEKLAEDVQAAASRHFKTPAVKGKKNAKDAGNGNPVRGVLFSSFIVQ